MINANRIVPVEKIDLISLYGLILQLTLDDEVTALAADDVEGDFTFTGTGKTMIADQPLKSCNSMAESGTLYFVPDYHFEGFKINSVDAPIADAVDPDGRTLYKARLGSSDVRVEKVSF